MLLQKALGCPGCWLSSASPPLEGEQDTLRLKEGSTQHVRGKQFITLPQLLTGGNIKYH